MRPRAFDSSVSSHGEEAGSGRGGSAAAVAPATPDVRFKGRLRARFRLSDFEFSCNLQLDLEGCCYSLCSATIVLAPLSVPLEGLLLLHRAVTQKARLGIDNLACRLPPVLRGA